MSTDKLFSSKKLMFSMALAALRSRTPDFEWHVYYPNSDDINEVVKQQDIYLCLASNMAKVIKTIAARLLSSKGIKRKAISQLRKDSHTSILQGDTIQ